MSVRLALIPANWNAYMSMTNYGKVKILVNVNKITMGPKMYSMVLIKDGKQKNHLPDQTRQKQI